MSGILPPRYDNIWWYLIRYRTREERWIGALRRLQCETTVVAVSLLLQVQLVCI